MSRRGSDVYYRREAMIDHLLGAIDSNWFRRGARRRGRRDEAYPGFDRGAGVALHGDLGDLK